MTIDRMCDLHVHQVLYGVFGHLPGAGVGLTAVPQIERPLLGVEQQQTAAGAQTGAAALYLRERRLYRHSTLHAEQTTAN